MRYLLPTLLLLCSSCIQIGSDPQPMHFYLLESIQEAPNNYSGKTLDISIELINFPDYLDRLQVVTSDNSSGVEFSDSDRWAEPLQDNLIRIIRENLALLLPDADITVSPWENSSNEAIKVKLVVNKFLGELGEQTQVDIRWSISRNAKQKEQGHFTDQQPIGNDYQSLVSGLNAGADNLSLKLAEELAGQ